MNDKPYGLGLIGCGGFGAFCMRAFQKMEAVRIRAVADLREDLAEALAAELSAAPHASGKELIARDDVDIVHVATPPSSHHELVLAAVRAGKHVLCEKPLALTVGEADEMLDAADEAGRIVPVNFVLRYNAVTDAVKKVLDSGILGAPLSARLTNCASDSKLGPDHWFWDPSQSGGIFIEHGVHFFDLYRHWFGPGEVLCAHGELRPGGDEQEDRVTCLVRHEDGLLADHYHGFDQLGPMDRTDHRIVCERGDICIEGWIPLTLTVHAAVDDEATAALEEICPGCSIAELDAWDPDSDDLSGRGKRAPVRRRIRLRHTPEPDKQTAYARGARRLLEDQIAYLRDKSHKRVVAEANGRAAVALAQRAAEIARAAREAPDVPAAADEP